jgi:hypothetical protein
VRPDGLHIRREFNKATVVARTKHAATKAAAVPHGTIDGNYDVDAFKRAPKRAVGKRKEDDDKQQRRTT